MHRLRRIAAWTSIGVFALALAASAAAFCYGYYMLAEAKPVLEGRVIVVGLAKQVQIDRDPDGVPTISAANRVDLARALGFLHGQERFFQMDLLRRAGAGELSGLVGARALRVDKGRRVHRFRARAVRAMAAQPDDQRAISSAYTEGVNAGLAALGRPPWEYTLLRVQPQPWTEADTALVVFAMYFDLQDSGPEDQMAAQAAREALGPALAGFLYPRGSAHDAAVDGSRLPEPPIPVAAAAGAQGALVQPPPEKGSNNFAVAGRLTATGAAMVANDMHLGLRVPNIWYRARMVVGDDPGPALDLVGVTLPGVPFLVVGSNRHVAWGFTDSYIESGDAVLVDPAPGDPGSYMTREGPKPYQVTVEKICPARDACQDLPVQDTIWGPVLAHDKTGRPVVWRWAAHDANAVMMDGFSGMERAQTVREALDAAHRAGLPQQNLLVGDSAGHIAWTVIGQIPRRVGLDDQLPHSWADGTHGWQGYLDAPEIPEIVDPPSGRLWSANARVVGGDALQKLGDGGYADALRAGRIRDDLAAREHFAETDLLAIQTDDRAAVLDGWQRLMLAAIAAHADDARLAAMQPYVTAWGGRAVPASVGYRLVRAFRSEAITRIYAGLTGPAASALGGEMPVARMAASVAERLLTERPATLLPSPFKTWDEAAKAMLLGVANAVQATPGHTLDAFTWGAVNRTGIHNPIAAALPALGLLTDPPDEPLAGDTILPRVAVPGFGASERLVVSPGHEDTGLLEMPAGQSDNPLSPYYLHGQHAWVIGGPASLLPRPAQWSMTLVPEQERLGGRASPPDPRH